mmetsp:Transcript_9627/g.18489  ORF Transcript_9627/g.18489 Transcript_9627/m.18489 type:complete len:236 (+) Transcript_9627:753-1460(+)
MLLKSSSSSSDTWFLAGTIPITSLLLDIIPSGACAILGNAPEAVPIPLSEVVAIPLREDVPVPPREAVPTPLREAVPISLRDAVPIPLRDAVPIPLRPMALPVRPPSPLRLAARSAEWVPNASNGELPTLMPPNPLVRSANRLPTLRLPRPRARSAGRLPTLRPPRPTVKSAALVPLRLPRPSYRSADWLPTEPTVGTAGVLVSASSGGGLPKSGVDCSFCCIRQNFTCAVTIFE